MTFEFCFFCDKCGKSHPFGTSCDGKTAVRQVKSKVKKKRIYKYRTDEANVFRHSAKWTKKSREIRKKAFGACELCRAENKFIDQKLEVHHIYSVREYPEGKLDNNNLISLCRIHHAAAENNKYSKMYLKELALEREKRYEKIIYGTSKEKETRVV